MLFLAGPRAAMCTGTDIDFDGGFSVTYGIPFGDYFKGRGVASASTRRQYVAQLSSQALLYMVSPPNEESAWEMKHEL